MYAGELLRFKVLFKKNYSPGQNYINRQEILIEICAFYFNRIDWLSFLLSSNCIFEGSSKSSEK